MPQIRELGFDVPTIRPTETGVEATAAAARRVGMFSNQVAGITEGLGSDVERSMSTAGRAIGSGIATAGEAADRYITHQEISHGSAAWAKSNAEWIGDWNERVKNADPNDPTVAAKFNEELDQKLSDFKDNFHTAGAQQWAEAHIDAFRTHMFQKTAADMSALAGDAAKVNARETVNALSNAVRGDPSSLDYAMSTLDTSIGGVVGSSPNLTGTAAASVRMQISEAGKEQIVKSAALGYIEKTGQVPSWATDPKYSKYINGVELRQFQKAADTQNRVARAADKQAELAQRQIDDLNVHKAATQALTANVTIDPTGKPIVDPKFFRDALEIARRNPNAPSAAQTVRTLLDWGEAQQRVRNEPVVSNPAVRTDLIERMFDPNRPTTQIDILGAEARHDLDGHDATTLRQMVTQLEETPLRGPVWQDTIKAVQGELMLSIPGIPGKDAVGEANFAKFMQTFVPEYLRQNRAGTLPPDALDVTNPDSLISKAMAPFRRTPAQRMRDYTSALGGLGLETPPAPGATPRPATPPATPPRVTTTEQFNALPSGGIYIGADGRTYRKP